MKIELSKNDVKILESMTYSYLCELNGQDLSVSHLHYILKEALANWVGDED